MSAETPVRWRSRGLGLDITPGCFVCGTSRRNDEANEYLHNVCARLRKEDEAAALALFDRGARMGYWHGDREAPQIKVGSCDEHLWALKVLSEQWYISKELIDRLVQSATMIDEHGRKAHTLSTVIYIGDDQNPEWKKRRETKRRYVVVDTTYDRVSRKMLAYCFSLRDLFEDYTANVIVDSDDWFIADVESLKVIEEGVR